ncbi:hypothetical protein ACJ6WF_11700 [Streptomyces sp. MMS24-I2-30]|uniref:hypothetical protein n=1 Tax=Streptomyces sp. MMS24-I2-30 TaxID=3351564 RepID=UPI003896A8A9
MTACAIEPSAADAYDGDPAAGCTITADGAYAARLALDDGSWFPERWTLDGPEPYAVPLPGHQPEEPGTEVQPMGDGRVLIHRTAAERHLFSLLYPTGPDTGELPLGAVECPAAGTRLRLLPPAPGGTRAYALAVGPRSTTVWLVAGGAFGPERLAEVPGRCSGGAWLDGTGRLLALDREAGGLTKAVVVDLERGGEVSPLLQIAADSDDRLLLADPDSGLLLIASDAPSPGRERLGWGVLGSTLPVRFPESLRMPDCVVTPFAIQPGQVLTPERCAVALRVDGPLGSWVGVWRPALRQVCHLPAPAGWLAGAGRWTEDGVLLLPYATAEVPCGLARLTVPAGARKTPLTSSGSLGSPGSAGSPTTADSTGARDATGSMDSRDSAGFTDPARSVDSTASHGPASAPPTAEPEPQQPVVPRPVPLQQAPLARLVTK